MIRVILDGYNVMFRDGVPDRDLTDLRDEFLQRVRAACVPGQKVVVVFDGPSTGRNSSRSEGDLQVIFSRNPKSADDRIVALVEKTPRNQCLVITHDRELKARVKSAGGRIGTPQDFFVTPKRRKGPSGPTGSKPKPPKGAELDLWERLFQERDDED